MSLTLNFNLPSNAVPMRYNLVERLEIDQILRSQIVRNEEHFMSGLTDAKFSKRVFWFGLAVVITLTTIAIVRVDALRAAVTESISEKQTDPTEKAGTSQAPAKQDETPEPLPEITQFSDSSEQPKLRDDQFAVKRILEFDEPFVHGFWAWDDEGVPDGEIIITVDLKAESMSVFRDGYEIGAAVISFGDALKPTPTGVFPITQKSKDHVSNIYGTRMPYMLRMTNDGISIHGADVRWGWGTRGCIGVPNEFAAKLFEQVKLGDEVIVTNGKMFKHRLVSDFHRLLIFVNRFKYCRQRSALFL